MRCYLVKVSTKGEGDQKYPKFCLRGLYSPPLQLSIYSIWQLYGQNSTVLSSLSSLFWIHFNISWIYFCNYACLYNKKSLWYLSMAFIFYPQKSNTRRAVSLYNESILRKLNICSALTIVDILSSQIQLYLGLQLFSDMTICSVF